MGNVKNMDKRLKQLFSLHILNGKGVDETSEEGKGIKDGDKMRY